jgi:hypothetical protein
MTDSEKTVIFHICRFFVFSRFCENFGYVYRLEVVRTDWEFVRTDWELYTDWEFVRTDWEFVRIQVTGWVYTGGLFVRTCVQVYTMYTVEVQCKGIQFGGRQKFVYRQSL